MSDILRSPGSRKSIPKIFLTRTESDVIRTGILPQSPHVTAVQVPLVNLVPDGLVENYKPEPGDDVTRHSVTSSLLDGNLSEEEEAVLDELDQVLGGGHDTIRIDSLDIDISTAFNFKGGETGSSSPLMSALRSSFGKVYTFLVLLSLLYYNTPFHFIYETRETLSKDARRVYRTLLLF